MARRKDPDFDSPISKGGPEIFGPFPPMVLKPPALLNPSSACPSWDASSFISPVPTPSQPQAVRKAKLEEMWKVYVGNLDSRITERELADEFRVYGPVRSVWVARNPPGYAFIEFDDRRDADDAISGLDGKHGWRVEMSRNYGSGRMLGRESSDVRCYDCGGTGHFARECRSRSSYRRSPSPHYRSSRRHSPLRSDRDHSRSPRRSRSPRGYYSRSPRRHFSLSPRRDKKSSYANGYD